MTPSHQTPLQPPAHVGPVRFERAEGLQSSSQP